MTLPSCPERPRYVPGMPLPPYSFVPGRFPHPLSDPHGHSYGVESPRPEPPNVDNWQESRTYLHGIDLFNHGYYWEAHESWESLWHACKRSGPTAQFLKGLIKLAAAGVKVREGKPAGVRSHAQRAAELFEETACSVDNQGLILMGLDLRALDRLAASVADHPPLAKLAPTEPVEIVFDFVLRPIAK